MKHHIERAISIRQPYAELILRGIKKNAFRSRPTVIRERVYIYAALKPATDPQQWGRAKAQPGDFATGVIVGSVEIVGCRQYVRGGGYAYALRKPMRFKKPMRPRGQPTPCFWRP
jgi:predicted transcriptional regulator